MLVLSCVECHLVETQVRRFFPEYDHYFINSLGAHFDLEDNNFRDGIAEFLQSNDVQSLLLVVDTNCDYFKKILNKEEIPDSRARRFVMNKIVDNYSFISSAKDLTEQLKLLVELHFIESFDEISENNLFENLEKQAVLIDTKNEKIIKVLKQTSK
jgi:hypothetical protein